MPEYGRGGPGPGGLFPGNAIERRPNYDMVDGDARSADPVAYQKIVRFMQRVLPRGPLAHFTLRQSHARGDTQVTLIEAAGKPPEQLASELLEIAINDSEHRAMPTTYSINAVKEGERASFERVHITLSPRHPLDGENVAMEQPNESGITSQLMRHNEAIMRQHVGSVGEIIAMQQDMLRGMQQERQQVMGLHLKYMEVIQQGMDRQGERELALYRERQSTRRKDQMFDAIKHFFPVLLKKFFAGNQSVEAMLGEEQIQNMLGSLKPEQMQQMMAMLDDQQRSLFITLYKAYKERKDKQQPPVAEPGPAAEKPPEGAK